jgi:hypothetical protein
MTRYSLALRNFDPAADVPISLSLRPILGPPFAGITMSSEVAVCRPGRPDHVAPFAFMRNRFPWVVFRVDRVVDAREASLGAIHGGLEALLGDESIEAVFTASVDPRAAWQVSALESAAR